MNYVLGIPNEELGKRAILIEFAGANVRVPDPLTLLQGKLKNLIVLNQVGRNDYRHVQILILCVRAFLGEHLEQNQASRPLLNILSRLDDTLKSKDALKAEANFGFSLENCYPVGELSERAKKDEKIRNYLHHQHPSMCL